MVPYTDTWYIEHDARKLDEFEFFDDVTKSGFLGMNTNEQKCTNTLFLNA